MDLDGAQVLVAVASLAATLGPSQAQVRCQMRKAAR